MQWVYQSAVKQKEALRSGEISAEELLALTIEHTEALSPFLNPIGLKLYDSAIAVAKQADRLLASGDGGPLCGVPITIKDSQWLAGERCANGSWTLAEHIPQSSSQAVTALQQAGAVIFAKTTCPEFSLNGITASSFYGQTSNPWDISLTCGGSSGGAAAAVAAGMGALSLGGDGGGSIRIPAAFCGITGFKPTHGVVKRSPGFKTWASLVSYGPMTRNVEDAELMFDVLADASQLSADQDTTPSKLIVSADLGFAPVDPDVKTAFDQFIGKLDSAGFELIFNNSGLDTSAQVWATIAAHDMWNIKGAKMSAHDFELIGDTAREFLEFGRQFMQQDRDWADTEVAKIKAAYRALYERNNCEILITPTMGCQAFPHGQTFPDSIGDTTIEYPWLDWAGFQYDANLTGAPAISIPIGVGERGLPIGIQISSLPGNDRLVLAIAKKLEQLAEWKQPEFNKKHYLK